MRSKRQAILTCLAPLLVFLPAGNTSAQNAPKVDLTTGKSIFEGHCAGCHGMDGGGGRGPSLHRAHLKHASDDKGLHEVIADGIPPSMPDAWYLNEDEIANVAGYVKSLGNIPPEKIPGDPKKGAEIYAGSGCSSCHILAGRGNGFGPELTEIGVRRGAVVLATAVLHPEHAMPPGFLMLEAVLSSGDTIRGIRVNEDSFTVQLRDLSGHIHSFRKSELKDLRKLRDQTPMPSYSSILSADEIQDLVAFLASQRGEE